MLFRNKSFLIVHISWKWSKNHIIAYCNNFPFINQHNLLSLLILRHNTWNTWVCHADLSLQQPLLQENQLTGSPIRAVGRFLPAERSDHPVCVSHHQLTASVSICTHGDGHTVVTFSTTYAYRWSRNTEANVVPMSLMRMTLVLAGICWVKKGLWSSAHSNSCWLDESDLLEPAAVRSNRWNHPSAPTATTRF